VTAAVSGSAPNKREKHADVLTDGTITVGDEVVAI
jgi:hypothetical protein